MSRRGCSSDWFKVLTLRHDAVIRSNREDAQREGSVDSRTNQLFGVKVWLTFILKTSLGNWNSYKSRKPAFSFKCSVYVNFCQYTKTLLWEVLNFDWFFMFQHPIFIELFINNAMLNQFPIYNHCRNSCWWKNVCSPCNGNWQCTPYLCLSASRKRNYCSMANLSFPIAAATCLCYQPSILIV